MELTTNYGWSMPEPTDPVNSSAEYAENMELIDGVVKDIADEVTAVDSGLTALATTVAGKVSKSGDTMSGALNMGGSKIQNVATPTAGSDVATKAYVDNIATADSIKKDGSVTFEASQSMGGHKLTDLPTSGSYNAGDAIPKQYVTDHAVTYAEGLTSDLNANNQKISALGTPTFNYDAANKKYVDDTVADIDGFLPITGGDMEGDIDMDGNAIHQLNVTPVYNTDAASKKYVDDNDALNLPLNGGTMSGDIIMDGNAIHQLPLTPTYNADAASKKYVDDADAATKGYVDDLFYHVNMTFANPNAIPTFDKTYAQIKAAVDSNKIIHTTYKQGTTRTGMIMNCLYWSSHIIFVINWADDTTTKLKFIVMDSSNTVTMYTRTLE